jgi:hypothetical protein
MSVKRLACSEKIENRFFIKDKKNARAKEIRNEEISVFVCERLWAKICHGGTGKTSDAL